MFYFYGLLNFKSLSTKDKHGVFRRSNLEVFLIYTASCLLVLLGRKEIYCGFYKKSHLSIVVFVLGDLMVRSLQTRFARLAYISLCGGALRLVSRI